MKRVLEKLRFWRLPAIIDARPAHKEAEMNLCDLSGKIAIVTGGNQGIGFAIARGLADAGATVVIA